MARPLKILGPWQVTRICDSPDGARALAGELDLSPGLVSIVKKECDDPIKRARRTGTLNAESVLQTIPGMLPPATNLISQTANLTNTVMTTPYDSTFDSLDVSNDLDYNQAPNPDNYYTPLWVQPQSFSARLLNPIEAMGQAVTTAFNSKLAMKVTEAAENFVHKLFPDHNYEVTRTESTNLDRFKDPVEKHLERQENRTEIKSKDKDDSRNGPNSNCSCARNKHYSSAVVDPSAQIGTESDVIGSKVHGEQVDSCGQSLKTDVSSEVGLVTVPEIRLTAKGSDITLPSDLAPPSGAPNDPGANVHADTPPKFPSISNLQHPILQSPASTPTYPPAPLRDETKLQKSDSDCSCLGGPKETVNADSPSGTNAHLKDGNSSSPREMTDSYTSSGIIPVMPPVSATPKEQQNLSTQEPVSGNLSQSPQAPPPLQLGLAEVNGSGMMRTNKNSIPLTMSRSEGTREKPEAPDEAFTKRSSIQQNSEHKSQYEQNSTSDTITDQSPIANQPVLPLVVDVVKTLSSTSTSNADTPFVPPLPPNGENEKTNGASMDQSSTQSSGVKEAPANPEGTPLKAEPSPNRTMLLTALVAIVGVGIALYILHKSSSVNFSTLVMTFTCLETQFHIGRFPPHFAPTRKGIRKVEA